MGWGARTPKCIRMQRRSPSRLVPCDINPPLVQVRALACQKDAPEVLGRKLDERCRYGRRWGWQATTTGEAQRPEDVFRVCVCVCVSIDGGAGAHTLPHRCLSPRAVHSLRHHELIPPPALLSQSSWCGGTRMAWWARPVLVLPCLTCHVTVVRDRQGGRPRPRPASRTAIGPNYRNAAGGIPHDKQAWPSGAR